MRTGEMLRKLRIERDYTLEYVANVIGVSRQTVQRYETGVISNIPSDKIEMLANLYKVSPGTIMGWNNPDSHEEKLDYYINEESKIIAQQMHDNPNLRILMDAGRKVSPEDLEYIIALVKRLRGDDYENDW